MKSLPFGSRVAAQVPGHRDVKFPRPGSLTSRLLFWDHLRDQISYILCPPEDDVSDPIVYRASLPVKMPPGANLDDLAGLQPLPPKTSCDKPLATDPALPSEPKDPDANDPTAPDDDDDDDEDEDVILVQAHLSQEVLPEECLFFFTLLLKMHHSHPLS